MTARANWFVDPVAGLDDEPDPFSVPVQEVGERIDLRDPHSLLKLRLEELLAREARLFNRSVTCPIKDRPDATCHACPVSHANDPEHDLSTLCRVGREQETVLTELAVLACRAE